MIIDFAGTRYELDTTHISFKHAMVVQSYTHLGIDAWLESTGFEVDVDGKTVKNPPPEWLTSIGALYWLMLAQNDVKEPIADMDFDVQDFYQAYIKAAVAELERALAETQAEAGPTVPSPPSPPSLPAAPPSPGPPTRTATTPRRRPTARGEAVAVPTG